MSRSFPDPYASGQRSAISNQFPVNRKDGIDATLAANTPAIMDENDKSADKYYRSRPPNRVPVSRDSTDRPAVGQAWISEPGVVRPLQIHNRTEVRDVSKQLIQLLKQDQRAIVVQLASDLWIDDMQLQLDLAVGRDEFPRERQANVRFEILPMSTETAAEAAFGTPETIQAPLAVESPPLPTDFTSFVNGEGTTDDDDGD